MSQVVYIIQVTEEGPGTYALSDGAMNLERAQRLMQFRAEEMLEENDALEVEHGFAAGQYSLAPAADLMSIKILKGKFEVASMHIQAVSLVDINEE